MLERLVKPLIPIALSALSIIPTSVHTDHASPKKVVSRPKPTVAHTVSHSSVVHTVNPMQAADQAILLQRLNMAKVVIAVANNEKIAAAVERNRQLSYHSYHHSYTPSYSSTTVGIVNGMTCGGDLPSCCTLTLESHGQSGAQNPISSASGLWQFTHDTWAGYGGYSEAKYAPVSVQNERARQVYNGGLGASNWYGDGCYNGR